jgi:hypothetical protein
MSDADDLMAARVEEIRRSLADESASDEEHLHESRRWF